MCYHEIYFYIFFRDKYIFTKKFSKNRAKCTINIHVPGSQIYEDQVTLRSRDSCGGREKYLPLLSSPLLVYGCCALSNNLLTYTTIMATY